MNFCPGCGQQLAADTRFCPKCGKETQAPTEPAATEPQPTPEQAPQEATASPQEPIPQASNTSPAAPPQAPQRPKKKKLLVGAIVAGVIVLLVIFLAALGGNDSSDNPSDKRPSAPDRTITVDGVPMEFWNADISEEGLQYLKDKDGTLYYSYEDMVYLADINFFDFLLQTGKVTEAQLTHVQAVRNTFVTRVIKISPEGRIYRTPLGGVFDDGFYVAAVNFAIISLKDGKWNPSPEVTMDQFLDLTQSMNELDYGNA